MKPDFVEELQRALPELQLRFDVPYRDITTLGVGGTLPVLAEIADDLELSRFLKYTSRNSIPVAVIGGGTNLVGMDDAFPGIGVRLSRNGFTQISTGRSRHLTAGAFVRLPELATRAAEAGFGGLAALAGIPGTLGGALRMNAGAAGHCIGEFVTQIAGVRMDGSPWTADGSEIHWEYRGSSIPDDVIITGAILELTPVEPAAEIAAIRAEIEARRKREPAGRSAGCTFRNVSESEPAGALIDRCGLKGCRVGAIAVSQEHANYLVNSGAGTEADYLLLLSQLRRSVFEQTGYLLRPEVHFLNPEAPQNLQKGIRPVRVNVLCGGVSNEREVSLNSGAAVAGALRNGGFEVELTDLTECSVCDTMRNADVVYPVLHGGFGEDGELQKVMEEAGLRFVGSDSTACRLTMDKIASKRLADRLGIPTAKWGIVSREAPELPKELRLPVILKAPMEGSTFGIQRVERPEEWNAALEEELKFAPEILVEEFIHGVEITVPIVLGKPLPVVEIRSPHGFYDYDAKYVYKDGHTEYFCPPQSLNTEIQREASRLALQFYLGAGCRDLLRVDFIVTPEGVPMLLEGNSLPGCTATSLVPKAAKIAGISFEALTRSLVEAALKRPQDRRPAAPAPQPPELERKPLPVLPPAEEPAPRSGTTPNPILIRLCRILFRMALWLSGIWLLINGFHNINLGRPAGFTLTVAGLFLCCSEAGFNWLKRRENK